MFALWIAWSVLTLVVISLAVARKFAAGKTDEFVHLGDSEAGAIGQQVVVAGRLETIDRWGKTLTIVDVAAPGRAGRGYVHHRVAAEPDPELGAWLAGSSLPALSFSYRLARHPVCPRR